MDRNCFVYPIIIIGMHRSGTTMVARVLDRLGLEMGRSLDPNHEPWLFLRLNDWLIEQCGGRWDNPTPLRLLLENPDARRLAVDHLRMVMGSPRVLSFLGPAGYLRHRSLLDLNSAWGWKDPRNTFTLPLWLELFPEARVIHVMRHGVDVAASLRHRQRRGLAAAGSGARQRLYRFLPKRAGIVDTLRCADLEGGLDLWGEYVNTARGRVEALGERAVELQYETILADPLTTVSRLARFCGLDADDALVRRAVGDVNPERAFAFRRDAELAAFAAAHGERLERFGYG